MPVILTLAAKDLRLLVRDRMAMFWVVGFPLVMAFMFGAMFGGNSGPTDVPAVNAMPVALFDAEGSPASREFATKLQSSKELAVRAARDAEDAKRAVLAGDVAVYVILRSDFEGPGMLGGKSPRAEIGFAPSRRAEGAMLRGIVMESAAAKVQEALRGSGLGGAATEPVSITSVEVSAQKDSGAKARPASSWEITFPSSILWGLIGCAATFAISLVTERRSGTFQRLRIAPITMGQLLAGKGLACFVACTVVLGLVLSIGVVGLGVRVQNAPALVVGAACASLCFTGLMMFLSTLGRSEQAASGMCWGIMTILAMLGGGMFPLFLMPAWMQTASNASPVKWGILALEGGIWRGFTMTDMALPCGILLAVGAAGFTAGTLVLSRRDR